MLVRLYRPTALFLTSIGIEANVEIQQNVLYVMTQGAYVHRDHLCLQVEVDGAVKLAVPLHNFKRPTSGFTSRKFRCFAVS